MLRVIIFFLFLFLSQIAAAQDSFYGQYIVRADGFWCPASKAHRMNCPASGYSPGVKLVIVSERGEITVDSKMPEVGAVVSGVKDRCDEIAPGQPCSLNYVQRASKTPNDSLWPELWGISDSRAPKAWDTTTGSAEQIAVVIDTGINYDHPELSGHIDARSKSIIDGSRGVDDAGHGTHVAGTICASSNNLHGIAGMNWNCKILSYKFLTATGGGSTFHAIKAIDEATALKRAGANIAVINASWGGGGYSAPLEAAIREASEAGIVFVAAAGNSAVNTDRKPHFPSSYEAPALISVASIDRNQQLSSFSNYGEESVDLAAPGGGILSLSHIGSGYARMNGTSMAAPHVSGAVMLLKTQFPSISAKDLRNRLLKNVKKMAQLKGKVSTQGKLDVFSAFETPQTGTCKAVKRKKCVKCCFNTYDPKTKSRKICKRCCALTFGCVKE